jgi:hypothetical protein
MHLLFYDGHLIVGDKMLKFRLLGFLDDLSKVVD